jgi:hypothetical protein
MKLSAHTLGSMDKYEICNNIFKIDNNIRFAGIVAGNGRLIAGGMRESIQSLEDKISEKRWYNQLALRKELNKLFDKILGQVQYTVEHRDKVKQLTVYLNDEEILFVSIEPEVSPYDTMHILNSILTYTSFYAVSPIRFGDELR